MLQVTTSSRSKTLSLVAEQQPIDPHNNLAEYQKFGTVLVYQDSDYVADQSQIMIQQ